MEPKQQQFQCPVCAMNFTAPVADIDRDVQAKRTDFHARTSGLSVLPYHIVTCPSCSYTGWPMWYGEAAQNGGLEPKVQTFVRDGVQACFATEPATAPATRYEIAATIAELEDRAPDVIADLWLRAAWCCVEAGDHEAERYYRIKAVGVLEVALAQFNAVERTRRALLTYLTGEVWRRIGDQKKAAVWFASVEQEVTDLKDEQWLIDAARQQLTAPREWF